MAIKILIAVAVLIVLFVIFVATRPSGFHVERSITINAPPENVFAQVNDFRAWGAWSPWEKKDPDMKRTYGATTAGPGATYAWAGNGNVGEGKMTIERSERPSQVAIRLDFFKPFAGTNAATFNFTPAPSGTKVTWAMDGHCNFITKGIGVFMSMDRMIGPDFESGLSAMKSVAESGGANTRTATAN
jgi:hypothetical protein